MSSIEVKSFSSPDEVSTAFNNAKIESVKVGGQRLMRLTLQPGWKWSKDIKPVVKTESCQTKHLGIITAGTVCARHEDGTEVVTLRVTLTLLTLVMMVGLLVMSQQK